MAVMVRQETPVTVEIHRLDGMVVRLSGHCSRFEDLRDGHYIVTVEADPRVSIVLFAESESQVTRQMEDMALAVLRGDKTAALQLADAVQDQYNATT